MENGDHAHGVGVDAIKHGIRETANQDAPRDAMNRRKQLRMPRDAGERRSFMRTKSFPKAGDRSSYQS